MNKINWLEVINIVKYPCVLEYTTVWSLFHIKKIIHKYSNPRISLYSYSEFKNSRPIVLSALIDKVCIKGKVLKAFEKYFKYHHYIITDGATYEMILPFRKIYELSNVSSTKINLIKELLQVSYHIPKIDDKLNSIWYLVNQEGKHIKTLNEFLTYVFENNDKLYLDDEMLLSDKNV